MTFLNPMFIFMFTSMAHISVQLDMYPTISTRFANTLIALPPGERKTWKCQSRLGATLTLNQSGLAADRSSHFLIGSNMYGFMLWRIRAHNHYWRAQILFRLGSLPWHQCHNSISQTQLVEEFPHIGYLQSITAQRSHRRIFALFLWSFARKRLEETWRLQQPSQVQGNHLSYLRTTPTIS